MFFRLMSLLVFVVGGLILFTQVIWPLWNNKRLFPLFNVKNKTLNELIEVEDTIEHNKLKKQLQTLKKIEKKERA